MTLCPSTTSGKESKVASGRGSPVRYGEPDERIRLTRNTRVEARAKDSQKPGGVVDGAVIQLRGSDGRDDRSGKGERDRLG